MVRRAALLGLLSAGLLAAGTVGACTSDDTTPPAVDGGTGDASVDLCEEFTDSGAACAVASERVCFPMCKVGGCTCAATAEGPRWKCVSDFSCLPDGGGYDVSLPPVDARFDDGGDDEDADAHDGGEAGIDGDTGDGQGPP